MIYCTVEKLCENGSPIVFHWIPGHTGLIGNKKANLAARLKAEKGGRQEEYWSLLAYVWKNLMQVRSTELIRWYEKKT